MPAPASHPAVRILGIDPGSQRTGWGVVDVAGQRLSAVAHGCIRTEAGAPLARRLLQILDGLREIIAIHAPLEAAVEEVFVRVNPGSALVLGQARGAALCALAGAGLAINEYTPARIKSAVAGHGRAEKGQVQGMIKLLLELPSAPSADAADALAVALCHARLRDAAARGQLTAARRRGRSGLRYASLEDLRR